MSNEPCRILVAEEDEHTRAFLCENLEADGYGVLPASDLAGALVLLAHAPDAVVCDLNGSTLELVDRVRASPAPARLDPAVPLLMLDGAGGELRRIRAYERGVDDVLSKPFSYLELAARLRSVLRRVRAPRGEGPLRVGPLGIDQVTRRVTVDDRQIELAKKEFALLVCLATEPRRVFTKEELLSRVWGYEIAARTRTLDSHVCRLRRKLGEAGLPCVFNVWGVGYRLLA